MSPQIGKRSFTLIKRGWILILILAFAPFIVHANEETPDNQQTDPPPVELGLEEFEYSDTIWGISFKYMSDWNISEQYYPDDLRLLDLAHDTNGFITIEKEDNLSMLTPAVWLENNINNYNDLLVTIAEYELNDKPMLIAGIPNSCQSSPVLLVIISNADEIYTFTYIGNKPEVLKELIETLSLSEQPTERITLPADYFVFPPAPLDIVCPFSTTSASTTAIAEICPGAEFYIPTTGNLYSPWACQDDSVNCPLYKSTSTNPIYKNPHSGLDIMGGQLPGVTPVYATYSGTPISIGNSAVRIVFNYGGKTHSSYNTHMATGLESLNTYEDFREVKTGDPPVIGGKTLVGYQGNYDSNKDWGDTNVHLHISYDDGLSDLWKTLSPTPKLRAKYLEWYEGWNHGGKPITCFDTVGSGGVDVYFLVDLTGSFYDDLPNFKSQAPGIIATIKASNPNSRFGLGTFEDYPIYPFGSLSSGDKAYKQISDLTSDTLSIINAINGLYTRNGYDWPESQLPALFQTATGKGQDLSLLGYPEASIPAGQRASFRSDASKLILLWTDAPFHLPGDPGLIPYPGNSVSETAAELLRAGITTCYFYPCDTSIMALDIESIEGKNFEENGPRAQVIGISSGTDAVSDLSLIARMTGSFAPQEGVDCNDDGVIDIYPGEPLVCSISYSGDGIGEAIIALVEAATEDHPPTIVSPAEQVVQYSDPLTFDLSASDPNDPPEALIFTATTLPADLTFTDNGDGTATVSGVATAAPGTYEVTFTVSDPGGLTDEATITILINPEDALATYTGPMLVSTPCTDCSTATVPLRATIQDITALLGDPDYDPNPGDITLATVDFINRDSNAVLCSAPVILLEAADSTTGTAFCDWEADIGANNGYDFNLGIRVAGYYTRDNTADDAIVVVSKPSDNSITGGGYLLNQPTAGTYAGDTDLRTHFGFNVKFIKNKGRGQDIVGRATVIIRHDGHVYRVKTNALDSLIVDPASGNDPAVAEFFSKASIEDVTDPNNPILLDTQSLLNFTMTDYEEASGQFRDLLGISLWAKNGQLLFSSNWTGAQTIEQAIEAGNLEIHHFTAIPK